MSPEYDPPPRTIGRFTTFNLAFLGANAVIAVCLVYALLRGGRYVLSPSTAATPPAPAQTPAASSPAGTPGDAGARPPAPSSTTRTAGASSPLSPPTIGSQPLSPRSEPSVASPRSSYSGASSSGDGDPGEARARPASSSTPAPAPAPAPPASSPPRPASSSQALVSNPSAVTAVSRPLPPRETPPPAAATPPPIDIEPGEDRTPPVLDSLGFDPPQISDGATATLLVHIHDDLSGVKSVAGNVKSPSGRATLPFEAQRDDTGTVFSARLSIPAKGEAGGWYVSTLWISDLADNSSTSGYTPRTVPSGGTLSVVSSTSDSAPPTVVAVSLDNGSVRGGERNAIHVDVEDDTSGVANVFGTYQSPTRVALIAFQCHQDADSRTWVGDIVVPANADCGEWTVRQLIAVDHAGNTLTLASDAPVVARAGFDVISDGCDSTAPELESFVLTPTSVSNETATEIQISAVIRDDQSGTVNVTGFAMGPVSTNGNPPRIYFVLSASNPRDPNSPWTGKIIVPQYAAGGTWKIGSLRVQDRAQNARGYSFADPVLADVTFEVH